MAFLHILLQILKWLGIVLGGLVGLVLLIVLLILFVPVRYKVSGEKYESASVKVRVSWLLHLVRLNVDWNGGKEVVTKIKVLFFTVKDTSKETDDTSDESEEDVLTDEEFDKKLEAGLEEKTDETAAQTAVPEPSEAEKQTVVTESVGSERPMLTYEDTDVILEKNGQGSKEQLKAERKEAKAGQKLQKAESKAETKKAKAELRQQKKEARKLAKAEKKQSKQERKKEHRFRETLLKIKQKVIHILEIPKKIYEKLKHKADLIREFLEDEQNKAGIALCKKILIKALKAIAPGSGSGKLTVGTGDPASTGYAMAGLAVLYSKLKGKLKVTPDFEESIIEGEGKIKGRIYLITLLVLFLKLWFNKNFKALKSGISDLKENLSEN